MLKYFFSLAFAMLTVSAMAQTEAQKTARKERIIASYMIAFGQVPQQGEIDYWMTDPLSNQTLKVLVEKHRQNMKGNKQLKYNAINNSYLNAMGRYPEPREVKYWETGNEIYAELFAKHTKYLYDYTDDWKKTIGVSYMREFNRSPKAAEVDYWVNQRVVRTYVDLVYNHRINKQKDPSLAKNTSNTQNVSQLKPSTNMTNELQQLNLNLNGGNVISTGGLNVISTGGLNVISTGGLNVISTGGLNVISTGGGN